MPRTIRTIFHAHNWSFTRIRLHLQTLKVDGYDAVQLSPAQKSAPGDAWFLRYQPFDHLKIEGLGDQDDLKALCDAASELGLTIIADVVFNHMAVPPAAMCADWLAANAANQRGDAGPLESLYAKLDSFPHLSRADFQPWREMRGVDWDNEHRYESWGNGEWPELRPTDNVLHLHKRHLEILYACGVRGFRFDAVKHMRVAHLRVYTDFIRSFPETCWMYGEVFSDQASMHDEYASLFPTTDFRFIVYLKQQLEKGLPLHINPAHAFLGQSSVRFGMNHDLACNPAHLVAGFLFEHPEQTQLANYLAVVLVGGTALVFHEDHAQDARLRTCIKWRCEHGGLEGAVEVRRDTQSWLIQNRDTKLSL